MSTLNKQVFRTLTGKRLEDLKAPTLQDVRNRVEKELASKYPVRELGHTTEGAQYFTEEDRESHIHILGSHGEAKSKFLEHLIRQDIDRGYAACLLDPSHHPAPPSKILLPPPQIAL